MAYTCIRDIKCCNCPHYRHDDDYGDKCCWAKWDQENPRTKLTDDEYNVILKLTHNTHLDEVFDIVDNGDTDQFIDRETETLYDLHQGLYDLYDGLVYSLYHDGLNEDEAKLIVNLFLEFDIIMKQNEIDKLLNKEE